MVRCWPGNSPFALALLAAAGVQAAPAGLVHHWNFDEGPDWHDSALRSACTNTVAYDAVGGAHAALRNMGAANWVSGRQFTALEFDGVNEYLAVAADLSVALGRSASFSFYIRTTQTGTVSAAAAPGVTGVAGAGGSQWGWLDEAGRIALSVDDALVARSAAPVNDGRWHHVVATRDAASGAGQVYLDGALSGSGTGATGARTSAFASLGRIEGSGGAAYFRGRLDQVTVFNRVIAGEEVATLRTNHAPKTWDTFTEGVANRAFATMSIFAKAYDVENDPLTVWSWTQPAHGVVEHRGDGSFNYTATGGYVGTDRFAVVVEDGRGGFHRGNMTVQVVSEPPGGGGVPVTQFTGFAALKANGADMSHSGWRTPRAIDWSGDGKIDLLVGAGGYVWLYANNGTAQSPSFASRVKVQAAGVDIYAGTSSSPIALMDMTGDGVTDLVLADSAGKLRVYRNTAAAGQAPVFAAQAFVKNAGGADFILPDRRFDLGDWDGDGRPDLVTGSFSGAMQLFLNAGTAADPRFSASQTLLSDSYNIYPRIFDLNGNGFPDFLRGINWGDIRYWRDAGRLGLGSYMTLTLTDGGGANPDLHALTDGAVVDFADFNGDGKFDVVLGGHAGDKIYLAYGVRKTVAESIAEIEAIYDAHPGAPGLALSANTNALLNAVNNANLNLISHVRNGTLSTRESVFNALTNHIARYPFLKYQTLDTVNYHHVPSIALQNWVILQNALADTPRRREIVADAMGLTGTARTIYLESGLTLGDNAKSIPAAYGAIRDFLRRHPRELFPDAALTIDGFYGDGGGGFVWTPNSAKNTFGDWAVGPANEWAADLTSAIETVLGPGAASGDYFTFVMGHEATHSLDGYVDSRANKDLRRRWGLMLCTAAGPEVAPGANGWIDWTATQNRFQAHGLYNPAAETWEVAWARYWNTGAGAAFKNLSFMRFDISWFLSNPQESLATQANHHWASGPGRLIGAVDRFRRATPAGLPPMKADINEVVTFIDFLSAGMNRVNLVETKSQSAPAQVNWYNHYADLERDDRGYIASISVDAHRYDFTVDTNGVVTDARSTIAVLDAKAGIAFTGQPHPTDVLSGGYMLDGSTIAAVSGFTRPAHGVVTDAGGGVLVYRSELEYSGPDCFTYQVGTSVGAVSLQVVSNGVELMPDVWWPLDDGSGPRATEYSACQAHGSLFNGPVWISQGRWRGALSFDGVNDYVAAGVRPSLAGATPFSLAAWVRTHEGWSGKNGVVIQQRDPAGYNGEYQLSVRSDGRVGFLIYGEGNYQFDFATTSVVNDGRWRHLVAVRDGAAGRIYIDGTLAASASGAVRPLDGSITVAIGADIRDWSDFLGGDLDDVRIYKRALSPGEVQELYGRYRPRSPRFAGLTSDSGGGFQFGLANSDVTTYTLLASTDLVQWCEMPGALQYSGGVFRIADLSWTNGPRGFFRLRWP